MKVRTIADLGVGSPKSVAERIRSRVPVMPKWCINATLFVTGAAIAYLGLGFARMVVVIVFEAKAIPVPFLDWWWVRLLQ
ncbi:MAG TPA: hypothetical protein VIR98_02685 [Candidatus Paceibacterota bacterium]|jgi:hypothetical protein